MRTQQITMVFEAQDDDHLIDETLDTIAGILASRGHTPVSTRKLKSEVRSLDWRTE